MNPTTSSHVWGLPSFLGWRGYSWQAYIHPLLQSQSDFPPGFSTPRLLYIVRGRKMRPRWRGRPSPALVRKETVKSFRVAAPIFLLQREPEQLPGPSRERRARIRKDGPHRKRKESPSCESHNEGLRGGGRLEGALGCVCALGRSPRGKG